MKILLLTNPKHIDFVAAYSIENLSVGDELLFKYTQEYDWSEDYDIGISFMYQHKVPAKEVNSHTWINFHPAPLPEYKGRNLCYHAIMNGEKEFGATVHYMDENFDTGDIIDVHSFPISEWYTAQDISDLAISSSMLLFEEYFPRILAGEEFERHPNIGGTYYKKEDIADTINLNSNDSFASFVRAVTYGEFYPRIYIGGVTYKIVKDE